jgi:A/G-specific adenine glycosylase
MARASAKPRNPVADDLGGALLAWWDRHRRVLPWRAPPGQMADPYAVWLSEIMLQQTTVASVTGYFNKFMARWPSVEALAGARLEEVLAAWAGLGYYARARNLHACAAIIVKRHGGRFPSNEAELLTLPGVGPYTAAAVAAIAFNRPCVARDGNVERVVARLFAVAQPLPGARATITAHAESFLSRERPGDFAQALMDLGATVCAPRAPDCGRCPLASRCIARRNGTQLDFPVKPPKAARPHRRGAVFVLRRGDRVLLRGRPAKGLLGGMSEFPSTPLTRDVEPGAARAYAPIEARWREIEGGVRHVFTHFSLELTVFVADAAAGDLELDGRWTKASRLGDEALPTLMRKVAVHAGLILA